MTLYWIPILAAALLTVGAPVTQDKPMTQERPVEKETHLERAAIEHRGRVFLALSDFAKLERADGVTPQEKVLTSPELAVGLPAKEIVVSWNADTPEGTGLKVEARAVYADHATKYYTLGLWSKDGKSYPRESVNDQKDADGDVQTDTLVLEKSAETVQVRVTLTDTATGQMPSLKFLGVCATDTNAAPPTLEPNRAAWGKEIPVPGRTQLGWPGGSGWCSPTSTDMTLAFWAQKLQRPELDLPVPDVAHAIYDKVWDGTGNWPFNTAFAGSFPGMRAYVTRLSDVKELEDWIVAGIPPIVSVSYDLLKGKPRATDPGHLMVCIGFTAVGDIVLNDPCHHPEKGEVCRHVYPRADFIRAWNRSRFLVYLIYPEGSKLPADPFGHWDNP